MSPELVALLGEDPNAPKSTLRLHPEVKSRWENWKKNGIPEKTKKEILDKYPRKGEMFLEAPKVNLAVPMTPIATKRDEHFIETQNCVGSAIGALGAAISMMLDAAPGEEIDQEIFSEYLSHTGQLLTDIFHQLSIARKSFITPLMDKVYKSTLDKAVADEWLYGEKFSDQVKDAKVLEKTSASIKASDKNKMNSLKIPGNSRTPPAKYKQVGTYQKPSFKFSNRKKFSSSHQSSRSSSRTSSNTSTKK